VTIPQTPWKNVDSIEKKTRPRAPDQSRGKS
jgi:hypothetical protein